MIAKEGTFSKDTLIPLGLVVTALALLAGGGWWAAKIDQRTSDNAQILEQQQETALAFRQEMREAMRSLEREFRTSHASLATRSDTQLFISEAVNRALIEVYRDIAKLKAMGDEMQRRIERIEKDEE